MVAAGFGRKLMILGIILFLIPFVLVPIAMVGMMSGGGSDVFHYIPAIFAIGGIGFFLIFVGAILSADSRGFLNFQQPVPPAQPQPLSEPSRDKVQEITCPNCSASPENIHPSGICTCPFCGTKYKVR